MHRIIVTSLALFVPSIAAAQPGAAPPPPPGYYVQPAAVEPPVTAPHRSGFLIGFSLGAGTLTCDDCDGLNGVAVDLHLGGMLTPNVALMFDGMGVGHSFDGGGSLIHVVDTVAAQVWVTPKLWLKGGLGIGRLSVNDEDGDEIAASETGTAAMVGIGYELTHGEHFALDLQLRGAIAHYDEADLKMGSLNLGFNWY